MKDELVYYKQELLSIPKAKEPEYRAKYNDYQAKVSDYEYQAKRLDLVIRNDQVGLLMLDQGADQEKQQNQRKTGGMYENQVVKHGFDT